MSGNNTLEISWWEKKLYDRGIKHNVALISAAVGALFVPYPPGASLKLFFLIPYIYSTLACFSEHIIVKTNPGAFIYPFWQTHTQKEGAAKKTATDIKSDSIGGVRIHTSSHLWCSVYSCLLISNGAGQSEHSGTTFPIGIIRILDRSDRLQCTQNHHSEGEKKNTGGKYISFPYSPV